MSYTRSYERFSKYYLIETKICMRCGAATTETVIHDEWHKELELRLAEKTGTQQ